MLNSTTDNAMATKGSNRNVGQWGQRKPPKRGRQAFTEKFLKDVNADWRKNGIDAIARAREADPVAYLRVMASLVPKDIRLQADASDAFIEALRQIQELHPKPDAIAHPSDKAKVIDAVLVDPLVSDDDTKE